MYSVRHSIVVDKMEFLCLSGILESLVGPTVFVETRIKISKQETEQIIRAYERLHTDVMRKCIIGPYSKNFPIVRKCVSYRR